jgi:hypothetical protein
MEMLSGYCKANKTNLIVKEEKCPQQLLKR